MKFRLSFILIFFMIPLFVFSAGKTEEEDFMEAEGKEHWSYQWDVSELPPGKYNILIRGTDSAGNVFYHEPLDIRLDPESDLPRVSISHPKNGGRVGEILTILGTAVDDDGVEKVEFRIDDGPYRTAEGTEYWSYRFDTDSLEDGTHTLSVRAVDTNGLTGNEIVQSFVLDTARPVGLMESHQSGVLLSGKAVLQGLVTDENGIERIRLSEDGGNTFRIIKSSRTDKGSIFKVSVNTKKLDDGPQVWWFENLDRAGVSSRWAFFFFVDNTPPEIEVIHPAPDQEMNGEILLAGTVNDTIGIRKLMYEAGDLSGEIGIIPGDPYWSVPLDFTGSKGKKQSVVLSVEDFAGNLVKKKAVIRMNPDADLPVITMLRGETDPMNPGSAVIRGFCEDDDGVAGIEISVDGGDPVLYSSGNGFSETLTGLTPGDRKFRVRGVDIHGKTGNYADLKAVIPPELPRISDLLITAGDKELPYSPGMILDRSEKPVLSGTVTGSKGIKVLEYSSRELSGRIKVSDGTFTFPLYKYIGAGAVPLLIKGDIYGTRFRELLFFEAAQPVSDDEPEPVQKGVFAVSMTESGTYVTEPGTPVYFFLPEGLDTVDGNDIKPPVTGASLDVSGNTAVLTFGTPGIYRNIELDGPLSVFKNISITVDGSGPEIGLTQPADGSWTGDTLEIAGSAEDDTEISAVSYRIVAADETVPVPDFVPLSKSEFSGGEIRINTAVPAEDGGIFLEIQAEDIAGRTVLLRRVLGKDTQDPAVTLITPVSGTPVNGKITFSGTVSDRFGVASFRGGVPGGEMEDFSGNFFSRPYTLPGEDAALNEINILLEALDPRGNSGSTSPVISLDQSADVPRAEIHVPEEGGVVRTDFAVTGIVLDDDAVQSARYRIDGGEWTILQSGSRFSIPQKIEDYSDGEHTLEMTVTDTGGLQSAPVSRTFSVSKTEPESVLVEPKLEETVFGEVVLKGTSSDPNGIESVWISLDSGNTYGKAEGTDTWTYRFPSASLEDGTHSVYIKAFDVTGTESIDTGLITLDNTLPKLILDSPGDGGRFRDTVPLSGLVTDNIQLGSLSLKLFSHADPRRPLQEASISEEGVFNGTIDMTELDSGGYILLAEALDVAGNKTTITRGIKKAAENELVPPQIFSPLSGEVLHGEFTVEGRAEELSSKEGLTVQIDDGGKYTPKVSGNGFFRVEIPASALTDGWKTIRVYSGDSAGSETEISVLYQKEGPWVLIESPAAGSFISGRPYLTGKAGFSMNDTAGEKKNAPKLSELAVSLDGGKSFETAASRESWKYRIETGNLPAGDLFAVVRAEFSDGSEAYARTQLTVDTVKPELTVTDPDEGLLFNQALTVEGSAFDLNGMESVQVNLRSGDKARYQVPSFIQGLYLDTHLFGANFWEIGAGLTFFDENVKLQAQIGTAPPGRFSGLVLGVKLLANIVQLPFSYFFGPDWDFFSMSLSVGANFSYFTMSDTEIRFTSDGLVLGAMVGQYEFAKFDITKWKAFRSFSFYTEGQLWFISSDIEGGLVPRIAFGMRIRLL